MTWKGKSCTCLFHSETISIIVDIIVFHFAFITSYYATVCWFNFILNLRFPKKKKTRFNFFYYHLCHPYMIGVSYIMFCCHHGIHWRQRPSLQYLLPTSDLIFNLKRLSVVLKYIAFKGFYLISILWTGGNTKTIESNRNFNSLLGWKFSITDTVLTPCDYGVDCWQWRLDN